MNCSICKNKNLEFVYQFVDSPIMQNKVYDSLENALKEKKAKITLYGCNNCGLLFNADFEFKKTEYSPNYNNSQDNSPLFLSYLKDIARKLNKKHNLRNKNVIEIGCGKGRFLKLLYDQGVKKIKGFDPSYINFNPQIDKLVEKRFFNIKNLKEKTDFIICRHVLEHIPNLCKFISSITKCLTDNGVMYFEFPDLKWIIENEAFFDFFYEHCNYFTKRSATYLFTQFGFKNIVFSHGLEKQYLQVEISRDGLKSISPTDSVDFSQITKFLNRKIKEYQKLIDRLDRFIIWGAGAKGVTFLNRLNITADKCRYIIDINPNKQGKFIPITGQKIVSPEIFRKEKIDNIIIMNPVYEKEIKTIATKYNYRGKFILL